MLPTECLLAAGEAADDGSDGEIVCRTIVQERRVSRALAKGVACVEAQAAPAEVAVCPEGAPSWWDRWGGGLAALAGLVGLIAGALAL